MKTMPAMQRCLQCGAEWWDSHVCTNVARTTTTPLLVPTSPTHFADDATLARIAELERENAELRKRAEVYAHERDRTREVYERTVRVLTGIHALLYPPRFTDNDGRTWQFKSPLVEEQMQELSDRIRALPDQLEAIASEKENERG